MVRCICFFVIATSYILLSFENHGEFEKKILKYDLINGKIDFFSCYSDISFQF